MLQPASGYMEKKPAELLREIAEFLKTTSSVCRTLLILVDCKKKRERLHCYKRK